MTAPERLVELTDVVSVLASEVAAVTADCYSTVRSRVYLRGTGGRAFLSVDLGLADVVRLLEAARADPAP